MALGAEQNVYLKYLSNYGVPENGFWSLFSPHFTMLLPPLDVSPVGGTIALFPCCCPQNNPTPPQVGPWSERKRERERK